MSNIIKAPQGAADVVSHDVTPITVETDDRKYARMGWFIVLAGVLGFLVWACTAPLDKGVPLSGFLAPETNRKAIQLQAGGTVSEILVRDGDVVKAGQVLVRMNDVQVKSAADVTRTQYFTARAAEARLLAELSNEKTVPFPAALEEFRNDPAVQQAVSLQAQLLMSRQMALQNELGALQENIEGLNAQAKGLEESRIAKKAQLDILKEQLDSSRDLAKEGYIPRSRLLDLERTHAQISGTISEDIGNIARSKRQVLELKLRGAQRLQEYQREVRTQLSDVQKEAEGLQARLVGHAYEVENVEVRSPVAGIVVGRSIFSRGAVVTPGQKMMEIVPAEDALVVEGDLPVNMVDRVHVGLPTELIFSAFNTNKTPHIPGTLIHIAADRSVDEKTGFAFYKVKAKVSPEGAKMIAQLKLDIVPGMPVELFVKTGERTMMSYLMKPVIDRAHSALSED
ncbi:HlyD family type I secretion periplasmic adaptor subunit [Pseudoduganella lutea]|uniref:Membrane fusion protein (MFP) family protein n=1 Tax=Pseudoduganella lutea TaxID=321985 RepID=A0A4P6L045_9BURK|nr:HlyD family type I secretion periplasmic adaptor subunit [Pseudoduganella lutea]QBE64617.1 HlyD family type I secretion periplasmic adaptor subunit [Pseudoduganella lutea]